MLGVRLKSVLFSECGLTHRFRCTTGCFSAVLLEQVAVLLEQVVALATARNGEGRLD